MRADRWIAAACLVSVLLLVCVGFTRAAKPVTAAWGVWWPRVAWNPVEQQTPCLSDGTHCGATNPDQSVWVVNPTIPEGDGPPPCAWDIDDKLFGGLQGQIPAGQTISATLFCVYADWSMHLAALDLTRNPELHGSVTLDGFATLDVRGGGRGCIAGPDYRLERRGAGTPLNGSGWVYSPILGPVPDSNGGVARLVTITYSITNPTSRQVRSADARAAVAHAGFAGHSGNWCRFPITTYGTRLYPVGSDPQVWTWSE